LPSVYTEGVKTVDDPRFQTTFEDVFSSNHLQAPRFRFQVVAGNHDHNGNVTAQIQYSSRSERWNFPSEYYSWRETTPEGVTAQIILIDTVTLCGNSELPGLETELNGDQLLGPLNAQAAKSQILWLEDTLANASDAD
jgi:tartrate-resistant acid phosphatase type 5